VIAVVGGDHREREIARQAAATGAVVRAYGFPGPAQGIAGVTPCRDPDEALRDAHYGLLPSPGMAEDGSLYAPHSPRTILIGREVLGRMAAGAHLILGPPITASGRRPRRPEWASWSTSRTGS